MNMNDVLLAAQQFDAQITSLRNKLKYNRGVNTANQLLCEVNYFTKAKQCAMLTINYFVNGMKVVDYITASDQAKATVAYGRSIWYAKYKPEQFLSDVIHLVYLPAINKQQLNNTAGANVMKKQLKKAKANTKVVHHIVITACGRKGKFNWNGKWDSNADLLFNNSEYLELRDKYGLPVSTFWQWVAELGLNSRLHKPLTIKRAQRTYYACHPDMFRMLVDGKHDELVKNYSANKSSMLNWYNRYLTSYYKWNGYNQPMTKLGTFTSLTFKLKKGDYTVDKL